MIDIDRWSPQTIFPSLLALALMCATPQCAFAAGGDPAPVATAPSDSMPLESDGASPEVPAASHVTFTHDGRTSRFVSSADTVGAMLAARGIRPVAADFTSLSLDTPVTDGMTLEYRTAKKIHIVTGAHARVVVTNASRVSGALRDARVALGARDDVAPAALAPLVNGATIRIYRNAVSTLHVFTPIAASTRERDDKTVARGTSLVIAKGKTGLRETTERVVRRPGTVAMRTTLGSRIVRMPQARVIAHGIATYPSLAAIAARGFSSAIRFAGNALHVIATAYTGACDGCSGITASGAHAGFGVIAVDPDVIPLGTKLFVPGYGRAVAGDTGGAIHGRRIDLGMNTLAEALHYGRRPVTVYILR